MQKFIANYTLIPGELLINHVVSIDHGRLVQCRPCDEELANTRYVDAVLCLAPKLLMPKVMELATTSISRQQFIDAYLAETERLSADDEELSIITVDPPYYNIISDDHE